MRHEARLVRGDPSSVASHELLDEKRATPGLPRHGTRDPLRHLVGRIEQRERQGQRVVDIEGSDGDVADLRALRPALAHLHQQGAPLGLLVAVRHEQEQRRRVGRTEDLDEERRAVEVAPVRVVDEEDERLDLTQGREELAQRTEGALSQTPPVVLARLARRGRHARDALHDGEEAAQRPDVLRQEQGLAGVRHAHQVAAEGVDHAVDRLERDRLALEDAATQDDGLAVHRQVVEEVMDGRRLPHARASADPHRDRPARLRRLRGLAQRP